MKVYINKNSDKNVSAKTILIIEMIGGKSFKTMRFVPWEILALKI